MTRFQYKDVILRTERAAPGTKARLRIVVSKKVARQAVRRNRIRRILKEAARKEFEGRAWRKGIVLVVLPGFGAQSTQEARKILHPLLSKASLLS